MIMTVDVNSSVWAILGWKPRAAILVVPPSVGTIYYICIYNLLVTCAVFVFLHIEMHIYTLVS